MRYRSGLLLIAMALAMVCVSRPPRPGSTSLTARSSRGVAILRVSCTIDGSDIIRITQDEATWIHVEWQSPTEANLAGVAWNPSVQTRLANQGESTYLSAEVDFSSADLRNVRGRGTVRIIHRAPDCCIVLIQDPPTYGGGYAFDIVLKRTSDQ